MQFGESCSAGLHSRHSEQQISIEHLQYGKWTLNGEATSVSVRIYTLHVYWTIWRLNNSVQVLSCPVIADILKRIALVETSPCLPARPFDKSRMMMKMMKYGVLVEWHWQSKIALVRNNPVPVPLCPQKDLRWVCLGSRSDLCGVRSAWHGPEHWNWSALQAVHTAVLLVP
jgi:hypothetical protein